MTQEEGGGNDGSQEEAGEGHKNKRKDSPEKDQAGIVTKKKHSKKHSNETFLPFLPISSCFVFQFVPFLLYFYQHHVGCIWIVHPQSSFHIQIEAIL